jgi:hypothetical protein
MKNKNHHSVARASSDHLRAESGTRLPEQGARIAAYGNFLELAEVQACEFTQEGYTEYAYIIYTTLF